MNVNRCDLILASLFTFDRNVFFFKWRIICAYYICVYSDCDTNEQSMYNEDQIKNSSKISSLHDVLCFTLTLLICPSKALSRKAIAPAMTCSILRRG